MQSVLNINEFEESEEREIATESFTMEIGGKDFEQKEQKLGKPKGKVGVDFRFAKFQKMIRWKHYCICNGEKIKFK